MPVKTAVRVISLESAVARREAFTRDARDAGLDWEFFPAYTGLVAPLSYDERMAVRRFGRPLSAGEIGCYTSHYKVWEWLAHSDYDQAFIFEDDMYIEWPVIKDLSAYNFAEIGIDKFHLIASHGFKSKTVIPRFLSPHIHLLRGVGLLFGAPGYFLTCRGAEILLKNNNVIRSPGDWIMTRYWEHGLPNYVVFPFPILEHYVASTIGDDRADVAYRKSPLDHIIRFGWRVRDRVLREWVEWACFRKNKFGKNVDRGEAFLRKVGKDK